MINLIFMSYNRSSESIHITIITIDITIFNTHILVIQFNWFLYLGIVCMFSKPIPILKSPFCKVYFVYVSILSIPFINYSKPLCCKSVWMFIEPYPLLTLPFLTSTSIFLRYLNLRIGRECGCF